MKDDVAFKQLQIRHDFCCEKGVESALFYICKECPYYYKSSFGSSRCLKEEVKDWSLWKIEEGKA